MVEELVQLYLKNKVFEIGLTLYNNVIRRNRRSLPRNIETERLFNEKYNFDVDINELPSSNILNEIRINNLASRILLNIFPFTKIIDTTTNSNIFYNYPDDYNGTSLLQSKYRVDINPAILRQMIERGTNLFIHNNEMVSPLSNLIKTMHYPSVQRLNRELTIGANRSFGYTTYNDALNSHAVNSPYAYLFRQYTNHTKKFLSKPTLIESIKEFVAPQFNEIKNIIQSNDSYNNNILINLELSFSICNYLTQHYLTENVFRNTNKYGNEFNTWIDRRILPVNDPIRSMTDLYYNTIMNQLQIPQENQAILFQLIRAEYATKLNIKRAKRNEYIAEQNRLNGIGGIDPAIITEFTRKINAITVEIAKYNRMIDQLRNISRGIPDIVQQPNFVNIQPRIIPRYDYLLNQISADPINKVRGSYIMGWKRLIALPSSNTSPDLLIGIILQRELTGIGRSTDISQLRYNINRFRQYYEHMHNICKSYFENPRFMKQNKVLRFVYDMLIHLTQNILCNSFELIIRKILFQESRSIDYLQLNLPLNRNSTPTTGAFTKIYRRIDYILTDEMIQYLYSDVAKKLVINSVSIYEDASDKESYETQTVSEILNSFIDLMATNSPIEIDRNTIAILKTNIVQYFDSIVGRTINNWNVCAENMFLFTINQYRIIETMNSCT
jgi:hypothetical protein